MSSFSKFFMSSFSGGEPTVEQGGEPSRGLPVPRHIIQVIIQYFCICFIFSVYVCYSLVYFLYLCFMADVLQGTLERKY